MSTSSNKELESFLTKLNEENRLLQSRLDAATQKISEQMRLDQPNQVLLDELLEKIDQLNDELKTVKSEQTEFETLSKQIKMINYDNIQKHIIDQFVAPKLSLINDQMGSSTPNLDRRLIDKIPKILFAQTNNVYTVSVTGFHIHHKTFKDILKRLTKLDDINEQAKQYYQRYLGRIVRRTQDTIKQVKSRTQNWKQYSQLLVDLLKQKENEYSNQFNVSISQKVLEIGENVIVDRSSAIWDVIRKYTEEFEEQNIFQHQIEPLKHQALEQFITQNISFQRIQVDKKPTDESIKVLTNFINKVKDTFRTQQVYVGCKLENFSLIPHLLHRLMIYYSCFTIQLPLFELSQELLKQVERNTVITIATSTGSGKSTLLPALLSAEGYDKIIVTQPRRLPCNLIAQRVNETMTTDTSPYAEKLAGWAVSGAEQNPRAQILYLTDGLLKERLLHDQHFLPVNVRVNKAIVLFIDEVHERSVNIDLCLALIARMLTVRTQLLSRIKIIISSATLDKSVGQLFSRIPQVRFYEFTITTTRTLYTVTKFNRPHENVLDIVQELYKKKNRHDQILCFVNSTAEVNQCCRLLAEISQGTIIAYPLVQSQKATDQQFYIEHGSVFFSTTVAETSLTFPSLKYIVDTGMINIPVYDLESGVTTLKEVRAAQSTIKQRLGRLGRTKPGEYYALYAFDPKDKPFPTPHICQSDLVNIEFSLRKSPLENGLDYLKEFLPDKPSQKLINFAVKQLETLSK